MTKTKPSFSEELDNTIFDCMIAKGIYADKSSNQIIDLDHILIDRPKLHQAILDLISREVIGEDIRVEKNGKELKRGDTVTIDMENDLEWSCKFIQENGKNLLKAAQRQILTSNNDKEDK